MLRAPSFARQQKTHFHDRVRIIPPKAGSFPEEKGLFKTRQFFETSKSSRGFLFSTQSSRFDRHDILNTVSALKQHTETDRNGNIYDI